MTDTGTGSNLLGYKLSSPKDETQFIVVEDPITNEYLTITLKPAFVGFDV